jgi:hypothetical protein
MATSSDSADKAAMAETLRYTNAGSRHRSVTAAGEKHASQPRKDRSMTLLSARILPATTLLACGIICAPVLAQDAPRSSTTVVTTDSGSATVTRSSVSVEDGRQGSVVLQGQDGRTATRNFARHTVRGEGFSSTSSVAGPNDRSKSTERSARRIGRGEVERSRQVTGPQGNERPARRWVRISRPD